MYFNQQFDLSALSMHRLGVFNPIMGQDNELFIDPKLLDDATDEFSGSRAELNQYFVDTIDLISLSKQRGDMFWEAARDRIISKEKASAGIGYSKTGKRGKGIAKTLAGQIVDRALEIMPHVDRKPNIFELMGIFAKGLGCDRLSDMIVSILADRFYAYTARTAHDLGIHQLKTVTSASGSEYLCPCFSEEEGPILLLPKSLLKALPIAANIGEALENANLNDDIRKQLNAMFAAAHKNGRDPGKADLREFIFSRPALFAKIVEGYEAAKSVAYDFDLDKRNVGDADALAKEIVGIPSAYSTDLPAAERVESLLKKLLETLRKLVEENRLSELLFNDDGSPKKEVASQRLIFAIAEIFSRAYDVDLTRESNAGNGAVDFKFSVGRGARVLIEIKLSSHKRIRDAYYAQLPAYAKSEGISRLVLLILQIDDSSKQIEHLREIISETKENNIQLEVIDARKRPSASKRVAEP
jgi:hypothetical protein